MTLCVMARCQKVRKLCTIFDRLRFLEKRVIGSLSKVKRLFWLFTVSAKIGFVLGAGGEKNGRNKTHSFSG
jgi:hypothetical protein